MALTVITAHAPDAPDHVVVLAGACATEAGVAATAEAVAARPRGCRLIVDETVRDALVGALAARAAAGRWTVAPVGPEAAELAERRVAAAVADGAEVRCGGHASVPTVLDYCHGDMAAVRLRTPGQVVTVETFKGGTAQDAEDAAVALAGDAAYGPGSACTVLPPESAHEGADGWISSVRTSQSSCPAAG